MIRPRSAAWIGRTLPVPCATPTTSRGGGTSRATLVSRSLVPDSMIRPAASKAQPVTSPTAPETAHFREFLGRDEAVEMERRALVHAADADQGHVRRLGPAR